MKQFDTLYARDSKQRINKWSIHIVEEPTYSLIVVEEGLIDGKSTITTRKVSKGKNIGKMNETSHFEQADSESLSRWEKKKKQGYKSIEDLGISKINDNCFLYDNVHYQYDMLEDCIDKVLPKDRTDENGNCKPMKAQPYYKVTTAGGIKTKTNIPTIKFPCFGQPKLNGFRVMARWETVREGEGIFATDVEKVTFTSKEGLRYDILEHIEQQFTKDMFFIKGNTEEETVQIVFDGEMYIHGEILSEIASAVRKRNPKTPLLEFHIFDLAVENLTQRTRLSTLMLLGSISPKNNIKFVPYRTIENNEEAQLFTDACIEQGYEGAIFRDMKATYQFGKRPQTMTKLKRSEDKEFQIVDVVGGDNAPDLGVFVCLAENGMTFKVTPEGDHDKKKEFLINRNNYIGKMLTVRFFERTKDDLPFHAVGVVRDYE